MGVKHDKIIGNTAADAYVASQDGDDEDDGENDGEDDGSDRISNAYRNPDLSESETGGAPLSTRSKDVKHEKNIRNTAADTSTAS